MLLAALWAGCDGDNSDDSTTPATLAILAGAAESQAFGSVDGLGSAARFYYPTGVTIGGNGNLFVSDAGNNAIRMITAAGAVTTFAGAAGSAGNSDGTGTSARFDNPFGIAIDGVGNVYVADNGNHTIRKITPTRVVTTFAGTPGVFGSADGTGPAATFYSPSGIAVDSKGNLFVADINNHTIRRVTPAGVVTTFAGAPGIAGSADGLGAAARFNSPVSIATDSVDNVFVSDSGNSTVRKVTSVGAVTTLAGTVGVAGGADGVGTAASFAGPRGLAADSAGNLYIADSRNNTIRRITPLGLVTTVVGRNDAPAAFVPGALPGSLANQVIGVAINGTTLYVTTGNAVAKVTNRP